MTTRDSMSDTGTGAGAKDLGRGEYQTANFTFMTLEEEADAKGWTRQNMPVGPGGDPAPAPTLGMRGEPDYDNDPTYGSGPDGAPDYPDAGTGPQKPPTYGGGGR
jgi:hypothetical protein